VVATALVILLLLFEVRGHPLAMVLDLLPLPRGCSASWLPPPRHRRGCS
jgi:hypothetical protein